MYKQNRHQHIKHIQTEQAPTIDYTSHWHRQKLKIHLKEKNNL